jgi:RND family efflux transporter MFP subunit
MHAGGLISRADLDETESRIRTGEAQLALAVAQVEQAEASLRELRLQQDQTRIYSPLDGYVAERFVDLGALVSPNTPLVSVVDISRVKLVVPVIETMLPDIRQGLSANISVDAYPDRSTKGTITRISPIVRSETRSADVEIEVPNSSGILRPGMFARVLIAGGRKSESLSIPRSALLTRGEQQGVFILDGEQMVMFRAIQPGRLDGNRVEIVSGLTAADSVVTTGAQTLNDGDAVRLAPPAGNGGNQ